MKHWNKFAIADVYKLKHYFMDKKEYILKLLNLFKDTLPLARGLIILIENSQIDKTLLDTLIQSFQDSLDQIQDEKIKLKLEKWKTFLEELRKKEEESRKLDEEDIKRLDNLLKDI